MSRRPRTILFPLPPYNDAEASVVNSALTAIVQNVPPDKIQALVNIAQNVPTEKLQKLGEIAADPKRLAYALKFI